MTVVQAVTLGIAILSLCVAIASLTWNVAAFVLQGARVKVSPVLGLETAAGVVTFPADADGIKELRQQMWFASATPLLGIKVVNRGRAATQLSDYWCEIVPSGAKQVGFGLLGTTVPCEIPAGGQVTLLTPVVRIRPAVDAVGSITGRAQHVIWGVTVGAKDRRADSIPAEHLAIS